MGKVQDKLKRKAAAKSGEGSSEEAPETEGAEVATEEAGGIGSDTAEETARVMAEDGPKPTE